MVKVLSTNANANPDPNPNPNPDAFTNNKADMDSTTPANSGGVINFAIPMLYPIRFGKLCA